MKNEPGISFTLKTERNLTLTRQLLKWYFCRDPREASLQNPKQGLKQDELTRNALRGKAFRSEDISQMLCSMETTEGDNFTDAPHTYSFISQVPPGGLSRNYLLCKLEKTKA